MFTAGGLMATRGLGANSGAVPDLPAGEMQAKRARPAWSVTRRASSCSKRLSKAAWTKEVDKMIKWGAVVDLKDREALIDYLSTEFSSGQSAASGQQGGKIVDGSRVDARPYGRGATYLRGLW
jgi:hypothetical protein